MAEFHASDLAVEDQYKLMSGAIIPRPIALTVTLGPDGPNCAPFSFFNCIGVSPPMFMIACSPKTGPKSGGSTGALKDTVANLKHHPEMVVHIVDYELRNRMNACALDFDSDVDETQIAGFNTAPSVHVKPPRITDCRVQLESRLIEIKEMGTLPYYLILGEVVHFHMDDDVVNDRLHVDPGTLDALGRMAGNGGYTRITDKFTMPFLHPPGSAPSEETVEKAREIAATDRTGGRT
ncbi:MAG: flavin reductase family protein [Alphaproteobacteria bacterium]|nr:flavin reductase family protein [Alphaproteobacteria bacterium]